MIQEFINNKLVLEDGDEWGFDFSDLFKARKEFYLCKCQEMLTFNYSSPVCNSRLILCSLSQ